MRGETAPPSDRSPAAPAVARCANCGVPLEGPYCAACGQENRNLSRIPLRQILSDWLGDAFTFDSRVVRTLVPLVRQPGFLTREYLRGRRARYVPPLRLFIFLSLTMFLALALTGAKFAWKVTQGGEEVVAYDPRTGGRVVASEEPAEASSAAITEEEGAPALLDDPDEISRRILDRAPQAMLLLVPVFGLFLRLAHRRREPLYVPHLIFSLHLHAFAFLIVLVVCLVDLPFPRQYRFGSLLTIVALPPYLYLAQRRVYGGGRWSLLVKTSLLLVVHIIAWVLSMLGVLMVVLALA